MRGRNSRNISLHDLAWALKRVILKCLVSGIPIGAHLRLANARARIATRRDGPSPVVVANMESALPSLIRKSIPSIAREHDAYRRQLYLYRILPLHRQFARRDWRISGLEYLDQALAKERGAILATAHLGFPHLIPPILRLRGYQIRQVVGAVERLEKQKKLEEGRSEETRFRKFIKSRTRIITPFLEPEDILADLDVRPIIKALVGNETVMIAGDGTSTTHFCLLELLGSPYPFPVGFIKIAMSMRVPVLPAFCLPEDGKIRVEIGEELEIDFNGKVSDNLQLYVHALNTQLRRTPHLWLRWRRKNWFSEVLNLSQLDVRDRFRAEGIDDALHPTAS